MKKRVFKVIFNPRNETYHVKITPNKAIRHGDKIVLHLLYVLANSIGLMLKDNISDGSRSKVTDMVIHVIRDTAQKEKAGEAE